MEFAIIETPIPNAIIVHVLGSGTGVKLSSSELPLWVIENTPPASGSWKLAVFTVNSLAAKPVMDATETSVQVYGVDETNVARPGSPVPGSTDVRLITKGFDGSAVIVSAPERLTLS